MSGATLRPNWAERVAPVERPASEARAVYDRLAPIYDYTEAPFESRARVAGLRLLDAQPGARVLEVGFGTGHTMAALDRAVGPGGLVVGVDLSWRMAEVTRRRFRRAGLHRSLLVQADARHIPLSPSSFDAVTMSFFLELVDTPDLPAVLDECRRVLRPGGRLVVVSLDLPRAAGWATRLYLAAHLRWPRLVDCRPIPLAEVVVACGFTISGEWSGTILGLPVAGVRATL